MHRWRDKPGGHVLEQRNRSHKARHRPTKGKHKMSLWSEFLDSVAQRLCFAWEDPQGLGVLT